MDELEKLALVIPSQPLDAEARHDRATAELLAQMLPQEFDCTCVQPNLKAALQPRSEDKNAPTYTQRSYALWRRTLPSPAEAFDAALAMDGLHPWALAALEGLNAKRRYVWLCDLPEEYLLPEDIPFFAEHYAALTGIFCASEAIREDFGRLFPSLAPKSTVITLPLDTAYYRQLSREPEEPWGADTADILAVCRLDSDNDAQQIPQLAARWKVKKPELRWHIAGTGSRQDRLVRDIVLADVCDEVELLDPPENLAPLMAQANAYLSIAEAGDEEAERMARAMGKTVFQLPLTEQQLSGMEARVGKAVFSEWKDQRKCFKALKEERL